jgi:hypothetical protein
MLRMRKLIVALVVCLLAGTACSPRDYLTRRLAAALIAGSETFSAPQQFWLRTGLVSNKEYTSPEYLVLQRRGWITAASAPCPAELTPPPCWDVNLTPLGVDAFHDFVKSGDASKQSFTVPIARRELLAITGISKNGNLADVEFTWQWVASSEVGSALSAGNLEYKASVGLKRYDDGWRLVDATGAKTNQTLEDALKTAVPTT